MTSEPNPDVSVDRERVVVVTGAAHGIGAAVAQAFAETGASVAAADKDLDGVGLLAKTLRTDGHSVTPYELDVVAPGSADALVARVESELGRIAVLVNVAGILRTDSVVDTSDADWNAVFSVNATGVFTMSRAVARVMIARRCGCIVTVSSNAGGIPRKNMGAYAASKAAATMLTKSLGLELAPYGIRCNVVAPGSTDTQMLRGMCDAELSTQESVDSVITGSLDDFKVGIPLKRLATPSDISDAVVFLCSEKARHITMQDLYIDGGATLR